MGVQRAQHRMQQREDGRPDPEALLKKYHLADEDTATSSARGPQGQQSGSRRGQLRVYLGAAAGVGKTYAMLNEGRRRKGRGTDVVVGYVESHGRAQTQAQIGDLHVIPRKKINYRGVTLEEMDTAAIIQRHPRVVLIDELAHTNVAGSEHPKRYQDVQDILAAGIDVITTLNVQHLESLNDLIATITGVRVRETLPDRILDQADEVELIDIAPQALRQRMLHGNIYSSERIEPALNNFFREGNLTALRELALRQTASKTESQLQHYMTEHQIETPWATTERVLVCFDDRPHSRAVIRDAWRLAHGMHADLFALYVEQTGFPAWLRRVTAILHYGRGAIARRILQARAVKEHTLLAEDLGADIIRRSGSDIAIAIAEVAEQYHVTHVVLGLPSHNRWEVMLFGSVTNRVLRLVANADIHIVKKDHQL